MFEFLTSLCSRGVPAPLEAELRRQRHALKAIDKFVSSLQRCLKYWDRSGKALRIGITGYFHDKPTYQRPVQGITAALDSLKTICASVKPQLELIKSANVSAAKSISRVQKANKRKRDAEKEVMRREAALKRVQQKAQSGKDPQAAQKVKAAEDALKIAQNSLQMAEAELAREMQTTMNGSAPEAAMQVARALEALILFLAGSGVDITEMRSSIRALEEVRYISPLVAAGNQRLLLLNPVTSKNEKQVVANTSSPQLIKGSSQGFRPVSPTDPGSQQVTPRQPDSAVASELNTAQDARLSTSPTNPFNSD